MAQLSHRSSIRPRLLVPTCRHLAIQRPSLTRQLTTPSLRQAQKVHLPPSIAHRQPRPRRLPLSILQESRLLSPLCSSSQKSLGNRPAKVIHDARTDALKCVRVSPRSRFLSMAFGWASKAILQPSKTSFPVTAETSPPLWSRFMQPCSGLLVGGGS